ncbi:hypothetical protein NMD99_04790 [Wolbachia endosymbiont of Listronotus oregonensis]|uniref:hypothetical protein n=1 Tax=Wolbachia endosymbiont of Listronotus oregonensis TaxID=2969106 RepID=UPI002814C309|nr:hypothetical protein [Wolbachia endosymbiont of Listronotus oregonensis]WMT83984.1 hypothetical protein NMD99_04790 [Wolbachia endosymbiont of Listronotus oregonensis]
MDIKELVKAFNLNNYTCNKINTNFTVEGKKIVGLFASNTDTKEYLRGIGEEIIKRHYLGGTEVASRYYNLNCFPFVLGANPDKEDLGNGIVKVKLAGSTNNEVIRNLKVHFANEFERAVGAKVVACLQKEVGITKEEAYEWMEGTVKTGAIGKPYLYCIAFSDEYLEREYDLETFEFFKQAYIKEFNSRLENCGLKSSDFYEYKDDMLYVKNVSDKVIKSVTEYVKKEVAFDFRTPGTEDSKVENFKDVLGDFIFKLTGKSINAYDYDIFTDKKKIENGNDFVLVPLTERYSGQLEFLKHKDVYKINIKYQNLISDIRGKTADPDITNSENPIYAISNERIAQLLPEIMQSPIAYSERNGRFEFAVDPENFKRRGSSRFSSTVNSPIHAGPSGLRTPPNQRKKDTDSGYDSNSPPKPKDSVAHSSSSDPRSSFEEIQEPQSCFPRRGVLPHNVGAAEVGAAESGSAGTSDWTQQTNPCLSQGTSENKWISSMQFTEPGFSGLSWKGANESTSIGNSTWWLPSSTSFLTTRNDSMSSSLGVFADSPSVKGKESIFSVEPEKQQVTDKSDLVYHVTEKSSVSKPFFSFPTRIKAKSNPPSGVTSPTHEGASGGLKPLTSDERKELRPFLSPELQKKLDSNSFSPGEEQHLYLTHTPSGKCEITKSFESPEENLMRCVNAQLPSSDNLSSEKVNRDSGFCSIGSASPAVPHKGSVSSELKHPQQVKHMSEALGK